jgi:hypothetical protein
VAKSRKCFLLRNIDQTLLSYRLDAGVASDQCWASNAEVREARVWYWTLARVAPARPITSWRLSNAGDRTLLQASGLSDIS